MLAFTNTTQTKDQVLAQIRAHALADEIVKGRYWENGKGCAVGCTLHSDDHAEYEMRFGIPQMLARLEDCIFEGLSNGTAKAWPERFMNSVRPGADLSLVGWKFLYWLLTDETVNPGITHPLVNGAVKQCADVLLSLAKGEPLNSSATSAASAAWRAESVASAASAARSAESVAWSAESAAWSAASAASAERSAAWSAESAAWNAAWGAASAASAESVTWSAASAAYIKMADKLVELIEAA